jgi:hypothetical protein
MARMSRAFVSRRRADEFDALLSAPARTTDTAAAYADLLELVGALQTAPAVSARAEFVTDLRGQLMVEAARQARPVDAALRLRLTPQQRHGTRERRLATVLGGFAIVAASGSMAMASQAALPGDVLYPVKRALENAHTNLQSGDAAKAETLIAHAQSRLDEAQQLTAEGADAGTVAETLLDFTDQSNQAADLALGNYAETGDQEALGDLRSFNAESMGELDALGEVVPTDARAALITAAQSVLQTDSAAFQICPTCGDGDVTQLPEFASAPLGLDNPLLSLASSYATIVVPPDYLAHVEHIASNTPDQPVKHHTNGPRGQVDTDPVTDPVTPPPVQPPVDTTDVNHPLQDLGDQIKDGLTGGGQTPTVDQAINDIVSGVNGLVDGLLGQ